jgi:hypothetical protein
LFIVNDLDESRTGFDSQALPPLDSQAAGFAGPPRSLMAGHSTAAVKHQGLAKRRT